MDIGLIVSFAGVIVAALAGVLGVWMERDPDSPRTWGFAFSVLIVLASGVELGNTFSSTAEAATTDAKLATVLEAMTELASKGDNPALEQFVGAELAVQARANPEVVKKMEKSIAAKGGDPASVTKQAAAGRRMAAGLPAQKPAAGERPVLAGARAGAEGRARVGTKAGKARAQGAAEGAKAGPAGAAARISEGGVGKAGRAAAAEAGAEAGAAVGRARASATEATTEAATQATTRARATATQATDDAKKSADQAKDDAKKSADKAKDDTKKKAEDAAGNALKGLGS